MVENEFEQKEFGFDGCQRRLGVINTNVITPVTLNIVAHFTY